MIFTRGRTLTASRVLVVLSLSLAGLCEAAAPAKADPSEEAEQRELARELEALKQRARALEERIHLLKAKRARRAQVVRSAPKVDEPYNRCEVPFYLDASGVKHLRPDCADVWSQVTCAQPFEITKEGIKQVRADCGAVPTATFERTSSL